MSRSIYNTGLHKAPVELSYSTEPQAVQVEISRNPASQYLLLNSKDRFQSSTPNTVVNQPWNQFTLQRPQSLMESFATRIGVAEIRFPWYIPNITARNNTFIYVGYPVGATEQVAEPIEIPVNFYNTDDLVTAINGKITALGWQVPLILSYSGGQYTFTPTAGTTVDNAPFIVFTDAVDINGLPSKYDYLNNPSLMLTLGFNYSQVSNYTGSTQPFSGNPTDTLYTQYVDIVSNKFNQYTTNLDGNSSSNSSNRLLCRLYLADEISISPGIAGYTPFIIHRQFKTPKMVMWNKESVVDWLDVSVVDQYNQLVPLPTIKLITSPTENETINGSYPDFQLTLLATEN
jgi:hypothetical protein